MVLTRLSSKGQLIIPKSIRDALGLKAGTEFCIRLKEGQIILEPIGVSPIDALQGRYADADLLGELEAEHRQEITDEAAVRP